MESRKIRFLCGENVGTETLAAQSSLGFGKLPRVGIKTDEVPARSDPGQQTARVSSKAQCAINSNFPWTRIENLEDFIYHDWHMAAGRRFSRCQHAGERVGISREFLVFLIKPPRVFAGVARAAAVRDFLAQSSLYFLLEPLAFETE